MTFTTPAFTKSLSHTWSWATLTSYFTEIWFITIFFKIFSTIEPSSIVDPQNMENFVHFDLDGLWGKNDTEAQNWAESENRLLGKLSNFCLPMFFWRRPLNLDGESWARLLSKWGRLKDYALHASLVHIAFHSNARRMYTHTGKITLNFASKMKRRKCTEYWLLLMFALPLHNHLE